MKKGIKKEKANKSRKSNSKDIVMAITMTIRLRRVKAESSAYLVKLL